MTTAPNKIKIDPFSDILLSEPNNILGKDKKQLKVLIKNLREILDKECPKLNYNKENWFLARIIRTRKYDLKSSVEMVKSYYETRKKYPEIFTDLLPSKVDFKKLKIARVLPERDSKGRVVIYFTTEHWDLSKITLVEILRIFYLIYEEVTLSEETQIKGVVALMNYTNFGLSHVLHSKFSLIKNSISIIQGAFPVKLKVMHNINHPSFFAVFNTLVKPLLKKKMQERIMFHGRDCESLYKHVDQKILPVCLGGDLDEELLYKFFEKLILKEDHYKELLKYGFED